MQTSWINPGRDAISHIPIQILIASKKVDWINGNPSSYCRIVPTILIVLQSGGIILNPAKKPLFDAIVANPPFSYRWEPTDALADDVRFKSHGLAPKSAADFAFLLHGFHFLKDEGVMAIILPHGVL